MKDYGRVSTRFWSSDDVRSLTDDGKLLALYLLTCEHTTLVGVLRLPDGYATEDLGWTSERVSQGFGELFRNGFANRCETTKWVWIRKFLQWNGPENPNQWKAARKIVSQIPPRCSWLVEFQQVFSAASGNPLPPSTTLSKPLPKGSETLSKPVSVSVTVSGAETVGLNANGVPRETNPTRERVAGVDAHALTERIKALYPKGIYRQSDWMLVEREVGSLLDEGQVPDAMIAGVERYAAQIRARGSERTEFVMAPLRFFSDRQFFEEFPLPAAEKPRGKGPTADEEERDALQRLKDRRPHMQPSLEDFRDPLPGETADHYRKAQDGEWMARQPKDVHGVVARLAAAKAVA